MVRLMLILFLLLLAPSLGKANDHENPEKVEQQAQQIIDACWAISEEDRGSGNTPRMRYGALDSALCMEKALLTLVSKYLYQDNQKILKEFEEDIKNLRSGYGSIIWNLYNGHDGCGAYCGTMYHVFHNGAYAHLLEDILKMSVSQVLEYDLDDALLGTGVLIGVPSDEIADEIRENVPLKFPFLCYEKANTDSNPCGNFSIRTVHDLYVLEGIHHEPYKRLSNDKSLLHFVSLKGFLNGAQKDKFIFRGIVDTNTPGVESESCREEGDFSFVHVSGEEKWVLETGNIPCLPEKGSVYIKALE